jgi:hypothetical protein
MEIYPRESFPIWLQGCVRPHTAAGHGICTSSSSTLGPVVDPIVDGSADRKPELPLQRSTLPTTWRRVDLQFSGTTPPGSGGDDKGYMSPSFFSKS